jgi:hypothetical protein
MRRFHLTQLAVALAVSLAACNESSSDPVNPPPPDDDASLHVVNAVGAPVSVTVDGRVAVQSLAAGALSERLGIGAGNHSVQLQLASGGTPQSVQFLAREGRSYVVSGVADQSGLAAEVDTGATPIPNKSKLRIIHAAANAPALDVWRTQPDFQTPIRVMFPFPYGAKSNFMESDPGTWEVWVTPEGQTTPKLATSGPVVLEGGWVRTLFLLDAPGGGLRIVSETAP